VVSIVNPGVARLCAAPIDGSAPALELDDPGSDFWLILRVARDGTVVFEDNPSGAPRRIHSVPADGSSQSIPLTGAGDPPAIKHEVSSRGRVVFIGYTGQFELFSVPSDASAPVVRLNPPLVAGGNIKDANIINAPSFHFSPDGLWVLFVADAEQDGVNELFAVPADGSQPARKMNGPLPPGGDVISYVFAPDSRRVLYSVWTASTREIFTSVIEDGDSGAPRERVARARAESFAGEVGGLIEDPRFLNPDGTPILDASGRRLAEAVDPRLAPASLSSVRVPFH